jgi:hypothetical protein
VRPALDSGRWGDDVRGRFASGRTCHEAQSPESAATHFAAVFGEDPHGAITSGLRFWKAPYSVDKEFAEVVWEVVASYPPGGVKVGKP